MKLRLRDRLSLVLYAFVPAGLVILGVLLAGLPDGAATTPSRVTHRVCVSPISGDEYPPDGGNCRAHEKLVRPDRPCDG